MAPSERAAQLLVRALQTLDPEEQRIVMEALLTSSMMRPTELLPGQEFGAIHHGRQMEQPFMVRLPVDLHRRLRDWATANGFSMAAIARGLIERFLDDQGVPGKERS
jgi:predicted HicB family RNase H-like nuclease